MGSTYTVRLRALGHDVATLREAVQSTLNEVDQRMSMFRPESELSAFNRAPGDTAVRLSDALYSVLAAADRTSRWSNGAFDVTVAPLVERWGFGTRAVREVPAAAAVAAERGHVDWRSLSLDDARLSVTKRQAGVQIDLGGIAKGYGVDRAATALEAHGVTDYMLEVGGEVRTRGVNAAGETWRIGIEEPDAMPQRARWVVPLSGRAMATSGDYRNYFLEDGQRYSHEIDPLAGAPIRHSLCSVTVVADDCMRADALATALIVLGPDKGRALAESSGIAAQFIERVPGGSYRDSMSPAFAALGATRA
jgi:thiamine biosynthesis lipoprotein